MATENKRNLIQQGLDLWNEGWGSFTNEELRIANRTEQQAGTFQRASEFFLGGLDNLGAIDNFFAGAYSVIGRIAEFFTGRDFGFLEKAENLVSQHRELPEKYHVGTPDGHDLVQDPTHQTTLDKALGASVGIISQTESPVMTMTDDIVHAVGLGNFFDQGGLVGLFRREVMGHDSTAPIEINPNPLEWFKGPEATNTSNAFSTAAPDTPENQERNRAIIAGAQYNPNVGAQAVTAPNANANYTMDLAIGQP